MQPKIICIACLLMVCRAFGQSLPPVDSFGTQWKTVSRFYREKPVGLFWFGPGQREAELRRSLRTAVDSAGREGLNPEDYLKGILSFGDSVGPACIDVERLMDWDRCYTEAALALARDLFCGAGADRMVGYDGVSGRFAARDEASLVQGLSRVRTAADFRAWIARLLPSAREYTLLRDTLALYPTGDSVRASRLRTAMNTYRWIHHFAFDRVIVVNLPSAELRYYMGDSLALSMKVVVGQPSKRTPRFAAWCDGVVLYPYWNVPHKIAVREMLPLFKMTPDLAGSMALEIVDSRGRKVDPAKVDWALYTPENFPYRVRQAPGCFNALGVIKFNLTSPYDVYLHDTNLKTAFTSAYRYYSHGCIRLEKPIALGMALLKGKLDTTLLLSCLRDQQPLPVALREPVPVFVVYCTAGVNVAGSLAWFRDVYQLAD